MNFKIMHIHKSRYAFLVEQLAKNNVVVIKHLLAFPPFILKMLLTLMSVNYK